MIDKWAADCLLTLLISALLVEIHKHYQHRYSENWRIDSWTDRSSSTPINMIHSSHYNYYLTYAALVACLAVAYIRIRSTEGVTITTKEFKKFQHSFLFGYGTIVAVELIAVASFFFVMLSLNLNIEQITKIYITTIVSTTVWGVLIEIFDIGSRRTKCALSAVLYGASMFALYFGGHYEMILLSRVIFGAASALHQSSYEAYVIHQHTILGFPEDWLGQTFSMLPHVMSIAAASIGPVGQIASNMGVSGCISAILLLSGVTAAHIFLHWEVDTNPPRFMWSNFSYTLTNTLTSIRHNSTLRNIVLLGGCFEASVIIFSFYWAPWLKVNAASAVEMLVLPVESAGRALAEAATTEPAASGSVAEVTESGAMLLQATDGFMEVPDLPYEIIFSCYICASMVGNYVFQIYSSGGGGEGGAAASGTLPVPTIFHYVLLGTTIAYGIGATVESPMLIFALSIALHLLMGAYWSCIGILRAQQVPPEYRTAPITVTRTLTLVLSMTVLLHVHHSPTLILLSCSVLAGAATYLQFVGMSEEGSGDVGGADEENSK